MGEDRECGGRGLGSGEGRLGCGGTLEMWRGTTGGLGLYRSPSESAHIQIWGVLIQRAGLGAVGDGTAEAQDVIPTLMLEITPGVQWEG